MGKSGTENSVGKATCLNWSLQYPEIDLFQQLFWHIKQFAFHVKIDVEILLTYQDFSTLLETSSFFEVLLIVILTSAWAIR